MVFGSKENPGTSYVHSEKNSRLWTWEKSILLTGVPLKTYRSVTKLKFCAIITSGAFWLCRSFGQWQISSAPSTLIKLFKKRYSFFSLFFTFAPRSDPPPTHFGQNWSPVSSSRLCHLKHLQQVALLVTVVIQLPRISLDTVLNILTWLTYHVSINFESLPWGKKPPIQSHSNSHKNNQIISSYTSLPLSRSLLFPK